uniref:G protein-coupled receptor n=1 Tax=Steinernema glaseri TaxID=37863 RepID=A0A1I7ZXW1_9BILA
MSSHIENPVLFGTLHSLASFASFSSSFRVLWVIMSNKSYRKLPTFQIMATVALLECCQMWELFIGGIMIALQQPLPETANKILGSMIICSWIGLTHARFSLAFNRFVIVTQLKDTFKILTSMVFHWVLLVLSFTVAIVSFILCMFHPHVYILVEHIGAWIYPGDSLVMTYEKYSAITLGFKKSVFIEQNNKQEIRMLFSFAATFTFELCTVATFHGILPLVEVHPEMISLIEFFWILIPAFNGVVLMLLNKEFRRDVLGFKKGSAKVSSAQRSTQIGISATSPKIAIAAVTIATRNKLHPLAFFGLVLKFIACLRYHITICLDTFVYGSVSCTEGEDNAFRAAATRVPPPHLYAFVLRFMQANNVIVWGMASLLAA